MLHFRSSQSATVSTLPVCLSLALLSTVVADECSASAEVGRCLYFGCFKSIHGQAHCDKFQCKCDPGACSTDGRFCQPVVTSTTTTSTTITTTTIPFQAESMLDLLPSVDSCGVREYMVKDTFVSAMKQCGEDTCRSWFPQSDARFACCNLHCAAKQVHAGLLNCWPQLEPLFMSEAKRITDSVAGETEVCALPGAEDSTPKSWCSGRLFTLCLASSEEVSTRHRMDLNFVFGTFTLAATGVFIASSAVLWWRQRKWRRGIEQPLLSA